MLPGLRAATVLLTAATSTAGGEPAGVGGVDQDTVLTVLGTVLVTLLAVGLGSYLTRRREHANWLRERRRAAYVDLVESSYTLALQEAYDPRTYRYSEIGRAASRRSTAAMAEVELVAPVEVARASTRLLVAAMSVYRSDDTYDNSTFFRRWHDFIALARNDLDVPGRASSPAPSGAPVPSPPPPATDEPAQ